jgi:hypothetical protein
MGAGGQMAVGGRQAEQGSRPQRDRGTGLQGDSQSRAAGTEARLLEFLGWELNTWSC